MRKIVFLSVFLLFFLPFFPSLSTGMTILTFDEREIFTDTLNRIPDGYGSLRWKDIYVYMYEDLSLANPGNAYNWHLHECYIESIEKPFTFHGAYISTLWDSTFTAYGYYNDDILFSKSFFLEHSEIKTWHEFQFAGINKLVLYNGNQFYIDNFTYSPVPVPSTILILATGLIGLAGYRRKFDAKPSHPIAF